mmetsp:Transcript_13382/g.23708  ORF Transcript_13382/g.23708 Transcript_13382/m.23708 type:complete len:264 (-) Transcript_13382:1844-2635(-)
MSTASASTFPTPFPKTSAALAVISSPNCFPTSSFHTAFIFKSQSGTCLSFLRSTFAASAGIGSKKSFFVRDMMGLFPLLSLLLVGTTYPDVMGAKSTAGGSTNPSVRKRRSNGGRSVDGSLSLVQPNRRIGRSNTLTDWGSMCADITSSFLLSFPDCRTVKKEPVTNPEAAAAVLGDTSSLQPTRPSFLSPSTSSPPPPPPPPRSSSQNHRAQVSMLSGVCAPSKKRVVLVVVVVDALRQDSTSAETAVSAFAFAVWLDFKSC